MNDLRSCICILPSICKSNTKMKSPGIISLENRAWIEHSDSGTEIASYPFDGPISLNNCPFCIEIVCIDRPIFHTRISHFCIFSDIYLYTPRMKACCSIFRRATSLNIMSFCFIFKNNECMFELTACLHIHAKICL